MLMLCSSPQGCIGGGGGGEAAAQRAAQLL